VILCVTLSDSIKFYRQTVKKDCFTQDSIVNEPLSPERIFVSSKSVLNKFVISRFLYCKKFSCDEKKNVSVCDSRKPNCCYPKNDFDRDFLAKTLCTMVIMKLHPLFIYICICMFKNDIFPCGLKGVLFFKQSCFTDHICIKNVIFKHCGTNTFLTLKLAVIRIIISDVFNSVFFHIQRFVPCC